MPSNVPRMSQLLDDPVYRAYAKTAPPIKDKHNTSPAWQLWIETADHKWLTRTYDTYAQAWRVGVDRYRQGSDFTITSRRAFYAPPGEWYRVKVRLDKPKVSSSTGQVTTHRVETRWREKWFASDYGLDLHWCGRCRRPVYWMPLHDGHHALRRMPAVTQEDNVRCLICGVRWISQPDISQMIRVERQP